MNYHNVEEYSGDFNAYIRDDQIDEVISYCFNDIESTTELLYRCKKDIELRLNAVDELKNSLKI